MNLDVVKALQNPRAFWKAHRRGGAAPSPKKNSSKSGRKTPTAKSLRTPKPSPPASDDDSGAGSRKRKKVAKPAAASNNSTPAPHVRVCDPPIVYIFGDADGYQEWRIRKVPEFGSAHIGLILANEKVQVDQICDSVWLHITTCAGVEGWCHTGFGKLTPVTASIYPAGSAAAQLQLQQQQQAITSKAKRPQQLSSKDEQGDFKRRFDMMKEEMNCDVCLGLLNDPVTTACGHTFCKECLQEWAAKKAKCPTCKSHVGKRAKLTICRKLKAVADLLS